VYYGRVTSAASCKPADAAAAAAPGW